VGNYQPQTDSSVSELNSQSEFNHHAFTGGGQFAIDYRITSKNQKVYIEV